MLQVGTEERNILQKIQRRNFKYTCYVLCRNCLLKQVTEGKIEVRLEVTGIHGVRRNQLLNNRKERRGYRNVKEEALDRAVWRTGFGSGL